MNLQSQRRTKPGDNSVAVVVVFHLGDDRNAFVVGDETAGELRNKLETNLKP
jgi:hypothetical protein